MRGLAELFPAPACHTADGGRGWRKLNGERAQAFSGRLRAFTTSHSWLVTRPAAFSLYEVGRMVWLWTAPNANAC